MQCYCMEQNAGHTDIAHCRYCKVVIILKYCPTLIKSSSILWRPYGMHCSGKEQNADRNNKGTNPNNGVHYEGF